MPRAAPQQRRRPMADTSKAAAGADGGHRRQPEASGLASGIAWNAVSLAFLAIAGIALNLAIGRLYGAATLGTFNIAFALFIFLSQIATLGLQYSALRHVPTARDDQARLSRVVYGGLAGCAAVATAVTAVSLIATPLIGRLFPRVPDLPMAWLLAAPGLLPFAINKYLLAVLNGLQLMKAYAIFQSARFIFILLALGAMALLGVPGAWLASILAIAEFALAAILLLYIVRRVPVVSPTKARAECSEHLHFGVRVFPAGMVAELNTRVDVLMVGALMNDKAAGIYTIAALIFEAALQTVVVVRNNINPRIAILISNGRRDEILKFSRLLALAFTPLLAAGAVIAYLAFPFVAPMLFSAAEFSQAREPLFWLMIALPLAGAPLCYGLVLSIAGYPLWQSVLMIAVLIASLAMHAVLIPLFGLTGAAVAMGLSTILAGVLSIVLARSVAGLRLFF